jgi:hypothetical protein
MSERDESSEAQKPKTSKLAIAAVILGMLAFGIFLWGIRAEIVSVERVSESHILRRDIGCLTAVIGLVVGILGFLQLKRSAGRLRGWKWVVLAMVINLTFSLGWFLGPNRWELRRAGTPCHRNISQLCKALLIYANDDEHGRFPTPDMWCDLLLESGHVSEEHFVCPRRVFFLPFMSEPVLIWALPQRGRCHYALNPNARGAMSLPDMVLLFETMEGWNQSGGLEILTTGHHEGQGCNVCWVDTHARFVDGGFAELKWEVEDSEKGPNKSGD